MAFKMLGAKLACLIWLVFLTEMECGPDKNAKSYCLIRNQGYNDEFLYSRNSEAVKNENEIKRMVYTNTANGKSTLNRSNK
jgi:hypothetical protein